MRVSCGDENMAPISDGEIVLQFEVRVICIVDDKQPRLIPVG